MKNKKVQEIYNNLLFVIKENFNFSLVIFLLTIVSSFAELLGIGMVFPIVQSIMNDGENIIFSNYLTFFDNYEPALKIKIIFIFFIIILILKNLILMLKSFLTIEYEYQLINKFTSRICKRIIFFEYKNFSLMNNSQIFNLLNKEIKTSIRSVRSFFNLLTDIIFLLFAFILVIIIFKNEAFFLMIVVLLLFPPLFYAAIKYSYSVSRLRLNYSDLLAKEFRSLLDGLKVMKIFKLSNLFMSKLNDDLLKNLRIHRNFAFITDNIRNIFELFIVILLFVFLIFYLNQNQSEKFFLSLALFATLFLFLFKTVTSALRALKHFMYLINQSSSLKRLIDTYNFFLSDLIKPNSKKKLISKSNLDNRIQLKNLTFSYDENNSIFQNVNLIINKSDKVMISGSSGTGKSTLVELLTGLNLPTSGQILVDDLDLLNINKGDWLDCIGFVGQKNFLFNKSIKKNIYDGNINASSKSYTKALEVSHTSHFLIKNKITDSEIIQQTQDNFSGGQLKRISIARALIKNPKILILDEATNEFEKMLEEKIIKDIINSYPDITIIFISHNPEIKKFCNKRFIIHNNTILEEKV